MSPIEDLLERLAAHDIRLSLSGDKLAINAPKDVLTPALRAELTTHKEALKQRLRASDLTAIAAVPRLSVMPVSHTQQRLWFLQQLDPGNRAYNIPLAFTLHGQLDPVALEGALSDLLARHESLRTRFTDVDGVPACVVDASARLPLSRFDLSQLPAEQHAAGARRLIMEFAATPFDLRQAPLLRVALIRLGPEDWAFCFVVHHIIADGWSLGVLGMDFQYFYRGRLLQLPDVLAPLPIQYIDYADWERRWFASGALEQQRAFWKRELGSDLPLIELPADRPRPRLQSWSGARVFTLLPVSLAEQLRALARTERATLFMLMLGAFQTLLYRYTGQTDLPVGTAVANRRRPEVERLVGFFANNIVLRGRLEGNPSVRELLARMRELALNAFSHQDMPFDMLVADLVKRRDLEHSPLFQVMFVLTGMGQPQPEPSQTQLPGLTIGPLHFESNTARFDLSVDVLDTPQGLLTYFEYNTELFEQSTIQRMLQHYQRLLEAFVADPARRLADLPLLGSDERQRVCVEWNATAQSYPQAATVVTLFAEQVAATPAACALRAGDENLSYQQLDVRSNRLAHHLRTLGVAAEQLVGLCLPRTAQMVIAQLAILKAGGAYVPFDPALPAERIAFMARDAGLRVMVTESALAGHFAGENLKLVCLDLDADAVAARPAQALSAAPGPRQLAYVIYTSGSTGRPKGVQIEHRALANFLRSMQRSPGIACDDRLLAVTTLSFDIAGLEILGPLTCGACVVLADRRIAQDGYALAQLIETSGTTIMQATPATWRLLLECGWSGSPELKLLCGGESLPRDLADQLLCCCAELWNMYGPTETTIWSTAGRIAASADHPGIGRPIANTQVYVLDEARRVVPIGVPGELYIGGDGLARGYLHRPELTADRFVEVDFQGGAVRLYRTGDLARWRPDGTLQCLGRADQQLKIRGYRVEPGEIEAALIAVAGITAAVVVARPDRSGTATLIGYVVAEDPAAAEPALLRNLLLRSLPDYMVPASFVTLERLPLTPNGKIDRKALPDPPTAPAGGAIDAPIGSNGSERQIAVIWQTLLGRAGFGRHDNFFDLGGHSLLIVRLQKQLQQEFGTLLPIVELFQYTTVAALAARLDNKRFEEDGVMAAGQRAMRRKRALAKERVA